MADVQGATREPFLAGNAENIASLSVLTDRNRFQDFRDVFATNGVGVC